MQIHLHLLSILRDCLPPDAKRGKTIVNLPEGSTLADLVSHFGIDSRLGIASDKSIVEAGWQVLVNGEFERDMKQILQEGDQVSIVPPLAGG